MLQLTEAKEAAKNGLKRFYAKLIETEYSIHTQCNVLAGIEGDLEEMKTFIQDKKADYAAVIAVIDAQADLSMFQDYKALSNSEIESFITDSAPSLDSSEQKKSLIEALDCVIRRGL